MMDAKINKQKTEQGLFMLLQKKLIKMMDQDDEMMDQDDDGPSLLQKTEQGLFMLLVAALVACCVCNGLLLLFLLQLL